MSPTLELARLEWIIRTFAAFYVGIEDKIDSVITPALSQDVEWPSRKKASIVLGDLELFAQSSRSDPLLPKIENDADVLGALYVVEGATLGGQLIGPHVARLFPDHPIRTFSAYGDAAPQRWKAFRAVLNDWLVDADALDRAKLAAIATFESLSAFEQELAS